MAPWTEECEALRPSSELRCASELGPRGGGCDYRAQIIFKAVSGLPSTNWDSSFAPGRERIIRTAVWQVSAGLRDYSYAAYTFLRMLSFTNEDHLRLLSDIEFLGTSYRKAACDWVRNKSSVWQNWLGGLIRPVCATFTNLPCGGTVRGTCIAQTPPYPEGRCLCTAGFGGVR